MVRCQQPIEIEKPFEYLLTFSYSFGERIIIQTFLFVCFSSLLIFSMPSRVIIIVTKFMFFGINIFWTLLRANPHIYTREILAFREL